MRYIITACYLSLAMITCAYADQGTVACKTEKAMVTLMKVKPYLSTNSDELKRMIKSGDCLFLPDEWLVLEADDPPLDQQEDHASKWTIRTSHGIVHMWGAPFGGD
ncbi:hypothetical protein DWU98_21390 [Dyella monticola]|uniref:DUF2845 domain-containing protein n=1 Tax=Dyella monticola TaxID=1927958 RepID=A0A370WRJ7_9GAMM|nr:hypothetical protein [Dyella monticola]RDS78733.1 hypothetical protein DWU98_21390 [Dyella monticola]